ncbi:MAG: ATP-grasp domain-containing protein [Candidatus Nanoarchaeia archaeon]|nr:ATP-grasp domain-containing protein [Candidatus Nanoarchaeia archaeon]
MEEKENIIFSNVEINPSKAYLLYIGNINFAETSNYLIERLERKYNKKVELIKVLPNLPHNDYRDNIIIVNEKIMKDEKYSKLIERYLSEKSPYNPVFHIHQGQINEQASKNKYVKKIAEDILANQDELYVNTFNTDRMSLQKKYEEVKLIGPDPEVFSYFNNRLNQRESIEKTKIPIPYGFSVRSMDELIGIYKKKFKNNYDGKAFVSSKTSYGGTGCVKVSALDDILKSEKLIKKNEFVISEFLDVQNSPCSFGIVVDEEKTIFVNSADQVMDGFKYNGTIFPSCTSEKNKKNMENYTYEIGNILGKKGFRGFFGVDFVVDDKDKLYFVEINPRKVGSVLMSMNAHKIKNPNKVSLQEMEFLATNGKKMYKSIDNFKIPDDLCWGIMKIRTNKGNLLEEKLESYINEVSASFYAGKNALFLNSRDNIAEIYMMEKCKKYSRERILELLNDNKKTIEKHVPKHDINNFLI